VSILTKILNYFFNSHISRAIIAIDEKTNSTQFYNLDAIIFIANQVNGLAIVKKLFFY